MSLENKISKLEESIVDYNETLRVMPDKYVIARKLVRAIKRNAVRRLSKAMLSL